VESASHPFTHAKVPLTPFHILGVSIQDGYGLVTYQAGPDVWNKVFRKTDRRWHVLECCGMTPLNYRSLMGLGVPEPTAKQLLKHLAKPPDS